MFLNRLFINIRDIINGTIDLVATFLQRETRIHFRVNLKLLPEVWSFLLWAS